MSFLECLGFVFLISCGVAIAGALLDSILGNN